MKLQSLLGYCRRRPCPREDQKHILCSTATNFMLSKRSVTSESAAAACFQATFVNLTNVSWLGLRKKKKISLFWPYFLLSDQVLHIQHFKQVASSAAICLWSLCTQKKASCSLQAYDPFSCIGEEYMRWLGLPQSMRNPLFFNSSHQRERKMARWGNHNTSAGLRLFLLCREGIEQLFTLSKFPHRLFFSPQTPFLSIFIKQNMKSSVIYLAGIWFQSVKEKIQ